MKTSKENSGQVTKDVLLHQIFQEISEENKEIDGESYLLDEIIPVPKTKLSKIRDMQKKRQWFFIAILVISIIYVLFDTDTAATQSEVQEQTNNDIYAIPKANQIAQEEKATIEESKNEKILPKTNPIQVIEKNSIAKNNMGEKEVPSDTQTFIQLKDPKTAREKAKAALRLQMQN